jgi:hypothetical protein
MVPITAVKTSRSGPVAAYVSHRSRQNEPLRTGCSVRFPSQPSKRSGHLVPVDVKGSRATPELRPVRLTGSQPKCDLADVYPPTAGVNNAS